MVKAWYISSTRRLERRLTKTAAYPVIPKGKSEDDLSAEAAELVLKVIKSKIAKHISVTRRTCYRGNSVHLRQSRS